MTKWRRTALWAIAILALAAIAGALALPKLVDPERLKRLARDKAQAAWSRELSIGEVSLALWPLPALHAGQIALANPPWAKSKQLVTAESVDARLELLPLLVGKVRVKSLDLDGVRVNLETGADGAKSWDLAAPGGASGKPAANASEAELLNLTQLTIRNADVSHRVKGGAPTVLRIDGATLEADPGLRDVRIDANLRRNRKPVAVKATFADLSRAGMEGAATDGRIDLDFGKAQVSITGHLPLEAALKNYTVTADLKAATLHEMSAFFGHAMLPTAPATAHFAARESEGKTDLADLSVTFGKHAFTGGGQVARAGARITVNGHLETVRLDWEKANLEMGRAPLPPLSPEELFHDNSLAWPLFAALDGVDGALDLKLGSLVLRNGIEMKNVKTRAALNGDRLTLNSLSLEALGGTAGGSLVFEGRKKTVRAEIDGTNLLLERWFRERGSNIPFKGGPMKVKAALTLTGDSMRALMASATGPVTIRMGPAVWASEKAGHAESVMASAFSSKNATSIDFECIGASLPFVSGRASGKPLIGARSTMTNLLTSGYVDFRDQTVDLRGPVRPKTGTVGLATFAGDIQITGKLRAPHGALDPISTPSAIVRGVAALATFGLSAVGTATADAERARKTDPCEAVFKK